MQHNGQSDNVGSILDIIIASRNVYYSPYPSLAGMLITILDLTYVSSLLNTDPGSIAGDGPKFRDVSIHWGARVGCSRRSVRCSIRVAVWDLHSNSQHRRVTHHADRCGETAPRQPSGARFHQLEAAALGPAEEARSMQCVLENDRGCPCRSVHVRSGVQRVFIRGAEIDRGQEEVKRNVSPAKTQSVRSNLVMIQP